MIHLTLPTREPRRLAFYLAMEEWAAASLGGEDCFFLWQVGPTVIFGRNQVMENEVNLEYCREHGVDVVRRKSGGGCVYSDEGNIMLSYVTSDHAVEQVFRRYLLMVADALKRLGFSASRTENNDIVIDGCKVSGNAFFSLPQASIVHGTMLYDTDFTALEKAITPSESKLAKHGVSSVRQRVANLRSLGLSLSIEEFKDYLVSTFCDSERMLTDAEILEIKKIEDTYKLNTL